MIISLTEGKISIPLIETYKIVFKYLGFFKEYKNTDYNIIIFFIRLPRVLLAASVGATLSLSGCLMQSIFKNPMADPGIIGISSGASLGAILCIAFNLNQIEFFSVPLISSISAITAAFFIVLISKKNNKIEQMRLLLAGIATSMFLGAISYIVLMNISGDKVKHFLFWTSGNFNSATLERSLIVLIPFIISFIVIFPYFRNLNLLLFGDEQAYSLGINPDKNRMFFLIISSIITASAVCVGGNISFIGLIIPHISKRFTGQDFQHLVPLASLLGAIFLVFCDLLARTIFNDISVGIITSLIGVPYFIYILRSLKS